MSALSHGVIQFFIKLVDLQTCIPQSCFGKFNVLLSSLYKQTLALSRGYGNCILGLLVIRESLSACQCRNFSFMHNAISSCLAAAGVEAPRFRAHSGCCCQWVSSDRWTAAPLGFPAQDGRLCWVILHSMLREVLPVAPLSRHQENAICKTRHQSSSGNCCGKKFMHTVDIPSYFSISCLWMY